MRSPCPTTPSQPVSARQQQRIGVARARIEITASRSLCVTLRLTTDDGDDDGALRNTALFRRTALAYTRGDDDGDDVA